MPVQTRKHSTLTLPWPTDWPAVFGTPGDERPLIVEIGFGYGHMLFHLAEQHPEAYIVGVELGSKPLEAVERRAARRGYENIRVLYGAAETLLHHLLSPASVTQIHINFPDPWFKRGHSHRRVMQRPTLDAVVSRLQPGGGFYLATDIDAYAEMSHALLRETPGLTNQFSTPWAASIDNRVTTKYEQRAREEGRTNKYFAYQRNAQPAPPVPVITELAMPNIVFATALTPSQMVAGFERQAVSFDAEDIHVSLLGAYESPRSALFEVYVKEPTIDQHLGFLVTPRQEKTDEYTLKLASFGHPRVTTGVHRAAGVLDEMIQQMADDYQSLHRKIRE